MVVNVGGDELFLVSNFIMNHKSPLIQDHILYFFLFLIYMKPAPPIPQPTK